MFVVNLEDKESNTAKKAINRPSYYSQSTASLSVCLCCIDTYDHLSEMEMKKILWVKASHLVEGH